MMATTVDVFPKYKFRSHAIVMIRQLDHRSYGIRQR